LFWLHASGNGVDRERPIAYLLLDASIAVFDRHYAKISFDGPFLHVAILPDRCGIP
jgi:hypothetical protein